MIVAGGGGGASNNIQICTGNRNGVDASITTSGTASANGLVPGGTPGNGGGANVGSGAGGGGFNTDGTPGSGNPNGRGRSYINGGAGGTGIAADHGGYGGGGCGWFYGGNGGGGGGYAGGGTDGNYPSTYFGGGGGGGSYNIGTNQSNTAGYNTGNGVVIITYTIALPTVVINPTAPNICMGDAVTLTAGGANSYVWSTSGNSSVETVSPVVTTTYTVTGTDLNGCSNTATATVTVNNSTSNTITAATCSTYTSPSGNYTYTSSGTYMDTIANTAGCDSVITINLTINNTSSSISPTVCFSYTSPSGNSYTSSGMYMDTIPNTAGCDSIITINLTVNTVNVSVTNNSPVLTANANNATYQWVDCNNNFAIINGANSQSYSATANGSYAVIVTEGFCTDTSACEMVLNTSFIENNLGTTLEVYPNPTNGNITINIGAVYSNLIVTVRNVMGQELQTKNYDSAQLINLTMDGDAGIYFVELKTNDKTAIIRVVKN